MPETEILYTLNSCSSVNPNESWPPASHVIFSVGLLSENSSHVAFRPVTRCIDILYVSPAAIEAFIEILMFAVVALIVVSAGIIVVLARPLQIPIAHIHAELL